MKAETDFITNITVSPIEKFENTKGPIKICKWKDRHNQWSKGKELKDKQ